MGSVRISVELEKASDGFKGEFMDDKIHRFPAGLRDVGDQYIVPMVVAIGPYHRASNHLKKQEEVKRAAAFQFSKDWSSKLREEVYDAVLSVSGGARKLYSGDALVGMGDHDFAAMMFVDACFLLQYMDVYSRFTSKGTSMDQSLRRFLFTNRACINKDIMLLENQLPWLVLKTVIRCLPPDMNYMDVVEGFIQDMGNTFEIDADVKKDKSGASNNNIRNYMDVVKGFIQYMGKTLKIIVDVNTQASGDSNRPTPPDPPHLLGLLRRYKTTKMGADLKWEDVDKISASSSAVDLAQIGIRVKAGKTALLSDMDVRERGPLCGDLSLASLFLDDTTACWMVNMAALEVTTVETFQDDANNTAVCSYLALLSMFMHREEDVQELRSKGILHAHHTDAQILTFFDGVIKLLPDTGCHFAYIMMRIQKYKESRRVRTIVYQLVYNNIRTIIQGVTIIGTLLGILQAFPSLN
jgi:hypothetical protein